MGSKFFQNRRHDASGARRGAGVPGKPVWVGLQITHKPEWHTYWKNSGDSGLPTVLEWTLPAGVTAGDIAWPTPQKDPHRQRWPITAMKTPCCCRCR
jgi:DsbC/DsbD-like thiol-disulfide interchange protein